MPEISVNFSENQLQAFIVGTEKKWIKNKSVEEDESIYNTTTSWFLSCRSIDNYNRCNYNNDRHRSVYRSTGFLSWFLSCRSICKTMTAMIKTVEMLQHQNIVNGIILWNCHPQPTFANVTITR
jgi:hypothetical protein